MKRAVAWLAEHGVTYAFHDYKKSGVDMQLLARWSGQAGWEKLLNTRGTTWRKLSDEQRSGLNEKKAITLMQQHPSLIKRPVLEHNDKILVGFDEKAYRAEFGG